MGVSGHIVILLLFCIGNLALQPEMACGLTSIDLALRWRHPGVHNLRFLKEVAADELQATSSSLAPGPSVMFDPNQSNKRTVKKGSDPIHNRQ
ncbi:unnamed protein product [Linum trigynum]|uniref:Uncharacterized protein n=1 Tax=Linum trigynum TaxID=586398 RepID=A0AAV2G7N9_9ROSI